MESKPEEKTGVFEPNLQVKEALEELGIDWKSPDFT